MKRLFNSWPWPSLLVVLALVVPWLVVERPGPALPRSLGVLALHHTLSGNDAADLVNSMHGRPVAEDQNAIGFYTSTRGGAVLYVALYPSASEAKGDGQRMEAKIAAGGTVFQGYRRRVVDGKPLAGCSGLGQEHFIFSHDRSLYWLAVHPPLAEEAVRSLIASLR